MARTSTSTKRPAPRRSGPSPAPSGLVDRFFEPVETGWYKVGWSLLWVVVLLGAVALGPVALAVVFGLVAAIAALHIARSWRRVRARASRLVAALGALAISLAATFGTATAGAAVLAATGCALVVALVRPSRAGVLATAGVTVRCFLGPGVLAASVVLLADIGWSAVGSLLLLAAGYDLAVYVWSADEEGPLVGRVAGILTVGVLTFALSVVQMVFFLEPFQTVGAVWVFGALAATLFPLGQIVASAMLPSAAASAPALRRLDSLLLAAPIWLWALWGYLA